MPEERLANDRREMRVVCGGTQAILQIGQVSISPWPRRGKSNIVSVDVAGKRLEVRLRWRTPQQSYWVFAKNKNSPQNKNELGKDQNQSSSLP
jgi:hypothetical protein